uniref:Uncharacterized protein n=1 Tax=Heterorhabditis bacteriophora TaxID=37862 RepID=A0A1I7XAD3_HETBA
MLIRETSPPFVQYKSSSPRCNFLMTVMSPVHTCVVSIKHIFRCIIFCLHTKQISVARQQEDTDFRKQQNSNATSQFMKNVKIICGNII